jgi:hypothetical protein
VRLVRIFRVIKLGARYNKLQLIASVLSDSQDVLAMLVGVLMLAGAHNDVPEQLG